MRSVNCELEGIADHVIGSSFEIDTLDEGRCNFSLKYDELSKWILTCRKYIAK